MVGLFCFIGSFLYPTTPQKMTNQKGEKVEIWTSSSHTHFLIALEPLIQGFEYCLDGKEHNEKGDGYEYAQIKRIKRTLYSIPPSIGWFSIVLSLILIPLIPLIPLIKLNMSIGMKLQKKFKIAGFIILCAVPLLSIDFYKDATVYKGYFHMGTGAKLIVLSYIFIGICLLFKPKINQNAEQLLAGDG